VASINSIVLIGNVGRVPEFLKTSNGYAVATIYIATTERYRNSKTDEIRSETEWHRVICWGRLAEIAKEYLTVGALICIQGRLNTSSYVKDGKPAYSTNVIASSIQFLSKKTTKDTPFKVGQINQSDDLGEPNIPAEVVSGHKEYGRICVSCGEIIPQARIDVAPATWRCISCQADHEKTHDGRRKVSEGFGGSREDIKKMKSSHWGEMVNRGRK